MATIDEAEDQYIKDHLAQLTDWIPKGAVIIMSLENRWLVLGVNPTGKVVPPMTLNKDEWYIYNNKRIAQK